ELVTWGRLAHSAKVESISERYECERINDWTLGAALADTLLAFVSHFHDSVNRDPTAIALAICILLFGCANDTSRPEAERASSSFENAQMIVLPAGLNGTAKEVAIPVPTVQSRVIASKLVSRPELEFRLAAGQ